MLSGLVLVLEADLIVTFKRLLDGHVDMQEMEGYGLRAGKIENGWGIMFGRYFGPKGLVLCCTVPCGAKKIN